MPKRGNNIRKRKDGRWEGRYKVGSYQDGRTKYRSVYGKTYAEAKEKLLDICRQSEPLSTKGREKNFGDVLEMWLQNGKIKWKGSTEYKYRYMIETYIRPDLGGVKMSNLSAPMINHFLERKLREGRQNREGGLSASYVTSMMLIIQSAMKFAVQEELSRPLKSPIQKPTMPKKKLVILSKLEQKKLEKYLITDMNPTKLGILLSLHAGLRIGEICALRWEDIDIRNGILRVHNTITRIQKETTIGTPKTRASVREIPISSVVLEHIKRMKGDKKAEYVLTESVDFMNPRTLEYRFQRILEQCNITHVNFHALRHTFATRCVEAGVDVKSLSEILGHSNVAITLNIYVHSSMEMKKKQIEKMARLTA